MINNKFKLLVMSITLECSGNILPLSPHGITVYYIFLLHYGLHVLHI